jgi:N-acetyl-anhydromuramyl-L-alanine amidase AmpD
MALWHPHAKRVTFRSTGPYTGGAAKCVWHTTEGSSAAGALGAYRASGAFPHFTADIKAGVLYQHLPLNEYATALKHPAGVGETNRDNCIQVEIVGFAAESGRWTAEQYRFLAALARWIERNHGVARRAVDFKTTHRMLWKVWHGYCGHVGHRHAPGNDHTDPGANFRQDLLLAGDDLAPARARLKRVRAALAARGGRPAPGLTALANRLKLWIRRNR